MTPELRRILDENYPHWKVLPNGDVAGVCPMTYGKGRLCVGLDEFGWRDGY